MPIHSRPGEGNASPARIDASATPAEAALEDLLNHLGNGALRGEFKREWPLGDWVVDFYFAHLRLAIEVDGGYHRALSRWRKDQHKTRDLEARGISVLRLTNREVLSAAPAGRERLITRLRAAWRVALERSRAPAPAPRSVREPDAPDYVGPAARACRRRALPGIRISWRPARRMALTAGVRR